MREDDMIDEMVVELAAANERIRELEAINSSLVDKANSYIVESGQLTNQLTAEREVSGKLVTALQVLVDNGGIGPESTFHDACAALAEVAAIRTKQQ